MGNWFLPTIDLLEDFERPAGHLSSPSGFRPDRPRRCKDLGQANHLGFALKSFPNKSNDVSFERLSFYFRRFGSEPISRNIETTSREMVEARWCPSLGRRIELDRSIHLKITGCVKCRFIVFDSLRFVHVLRPPDRDHIEATGSTQ